MGSTPSKGMTGDMFAKKLLDGVNYRMAEGRKTRDSAASWAIELHLVSENIHEFLHCKLMVTGEKISGMNESVADTV